MRLARLATLALAVSCAAGAAGCALTYDSTELGVPVRLADTTTATGTPFRVTKHPVFILWGAATASPPNVEDVLAGQLGAGAALDGVRIREHMRLTDLAVTVVTLGLFSPRTVTIEGRIVGAAPAAH